jgi:hypothetical protein
MVLLTTKFLDVGKVYYSNSIIITNFVWTLIPNCRFQNIFPAYFLIKITQQNFRIIPREVIKYMSCFFIEAVLYIIAIILTWDMNI